MAPSYVLVVALAVFSGLAAAQICNPYTTRKDCGFVGITQQQCQNNGCCWIPDEEHDPYCFYSNPVTNNYFIQSIQPTSTGYHAVLGLVSNSSAIFGPDIGPLNMDVYFETATRLHVKIYDPNNARYEVPQTLLPRPEVSTAASNPQYKFSYTSSPFGFAVSRVSTGEVLFNTTVPPVNQQFNGLTFEDQFLEISTQLIPNANLYGIGDQKRPFQLDVSGNTSYTLWASDHAMPFGQNIYASQPFYTEIRPASGGLAHGVLLLNSDAMDVFAFPNALNFRTIGGVLDFYFFLGPGPKDVISQYHNFIGLPHMPPYWALGWHQCRYGYQNLQELEQVVENYSIAQIPLDTMWTDIDYMDNYLDFTWSPTNFPQAGMATFVEQLHANNQHYVVIVDPGISIDTTYAPYQQGIVSSVFVKDASGDYFVGDVWPGLTNYPDWFAPNTSSWWANQIQGFLAGVAIDGLWTDMNEASNFCNGECSNNGGVRRPVTLEAARALASKSTAEALQKARARRPAPRQVATPAGFNAQEPPYAINNFGNHLPLNTHAMDPDAVHYGGLLDYDVHNLYGFGEAIATDAALEKIRQQRSLVISRSTFPGAGKYAGHWLGDNDSSFGDLYYSIAGILNYQLFGLTLVGADICGFNGNTTEELCGRWMALGSFYPFARNHNDITSIPQEPYRWPSVAAISRQYLGIRYSLLPYYYTLFYYVHNNGGMVWRPLVFEFPTDVNTVAIDRQLLVGGGILITPVLTQGATSVVGYFPAGQWYDLLTYVPLPSPTTGRTLTLQAPISYLPIHVRGGTILPMQTPSLTTPQTRLNPFSLLVAPDLNGKASGSLYWDDGVSLGMTPNSLFNFTATVSGSTGSVTITPVGPNGNPPPALTSFVVMGVQSAPSAATLNGASLAAAQIQYASNSTSVIFTGLTVAWGSVSLQWH